MHMGNVVSEIEGLWYEVISESKEAKIIYHNVPDPYVTGRPCETKGIQRYYLN
jgi:hypothetical protein